MAWHRDSYRVSADTRWGQLSLVVQEKSPADLTSINKIFAREPCSIFVGWWPYDRKSTFKIQYNGAYATSLWPLYPKYLAVTKGGYSRTMAFSWETSVSEKRPDGIFKVQRHRMASIEGHSIICFACTIIKYILKTWVSIQGKSSILFMLPLERLTWSFSASARTRMLFSLVRTWLLWVGRNRPRWINTTARARLMHTFKREALFW